MRWITQNPSRVFADKRCTRKIAIPEETSFYRIVVANGISSQISRDLGGSGSLMIAHSGCNPLDKTNSGIYEIRSDYKDAAIYHVFDENNLRDILESLNTISDFVSYLDSREWLFRSGISVFAPGEEELLAHYLQHFDPECGRGFERVGNADLLVVEEGTWDEFKAGPYFQSARNANRVSAIWDEIIEQFSEDLLGSRLRGSEGFSERQIRLPLELMASENRFNRRSLAECICDVSSFQLDTADQYVRVVKSSTQRPTTYLMLALRHPDGVRRDDYVSMRVQILYDYCLVLKWKHQIDGDVIGIGLDRANSKLRSYDIVHFENGDLTIDEIVRADSIHSERGFLTNVRSEQVHSFEYPFEGAPTHLKIANKGLKGNMRNQGCSCGSGRKYKHCCGKKSQVSGRWEFIDL